MSAAPGPSRLPRIIVLAAILLSLVGCDQATKVYAVKHLKGQPQKSYLADTVRVLYVENPGAFLGVFGWLKPEVKFWVLTVGTAVVLTWVLVYVVSSRTIDRWVFVAFALILAGGIGNLIDRFRLGGFVIDFLNVGFGKAVWQRTGIFNVADVAITAGFIVLLPFVFKGEPKPATPAPPATPSPQ